MQPKKPRYQIEIDEWNHRKEVLQIMKQYDIPVSKYYEFRFHVIGKTISASCYVIGWFMPFYFAGSLESGNTIYSHFYTRHFSFTQRRKEAKSREKNLRLCFFAPLRETTTCFYFAFIIKFGIQYPIQ